MITAPDQHKPTNRRLAYTGAVLSAIFLILMATDTREGYTGPLFSAGTGLLLLVVVAVDVWMGRVGLRRRR